MKAKKIYFLFTLLPLSLCALPVGEKVKAGSALFSKQEGILQIEASDKTIIDFKSFHIENGEKVLFVQPRSSSTLLSRVQGSDPSQILGTLSSNGKVFLVNPHGVYFGQDAIVDTGSLIVSTLDVLNEDFLQERYCFFSKPGQQLGEIRNEGILTALEGSVALIGPRIANEGVILADVGRVLLASAEKVTLDFSGDGMMAFAVDNMMTAEALQDQVVLGQSATQKIIEGVINADGLVAGSALVEKEGIIRLVSSSHIAAQDIAIAGANIQLEGSLVAQRDLHVEAQQVLCARDRSETPLVLHTQRHFTLDAPVIDILTLQHPETRIESGGNMTFLSNSLISADGHFYAGGNFALLTLEGNPGDFRSFFDPIITSNESVTFGSYNGVSLKVQAAGNITCTGTINITGVDTVSCMACISDPDCHTLKSSRTLILRAGTTPSVTCVAVPPNVMDGGTTFVGSSGSGSTIALSGNITGIETAIFDGTVILENTISITGMPNSSLSFGGTIDASTAGTQGLSLDAMGGTITFEGSIGVGAKLSTLSATAGDIILEGIVTFETAGAMVFNSPIDGLNLDVDGVELSSGSTITLGGNIGATKRLIFFSVAQGKVLLDNTVDIFTSNDMTFTTSMDSSIAGMNGLSLNASQGAITFNSDIGVMGALSSLSVIAAQGITIDNTLEINTSGTMTFNSPINQPFGTTPGLYALTLNAGGVMNLNSDIGAKTAFGNISLVATDGIILGNTAENIVELDSLGLIQVRSTIDCLTAGMNGLVLNAATVDLYENIGAAEALANFSVSAPMGIILENTVTIDVSDSITFDGIINSLVPGLSGLSLNAEGSITFTGNIENLSTFFVEATDGIFLENTLAINITGNMTFNAGINSVPAGNMGLSLDSTGGVIALNGNIGLIAPLATLTVTSPVGIDLGASITTSENAGLTLSGPLMLTGDATITPGGAITFFSTVDSSIMGGPFDLTIISTSHTVTFEDAVGAISPLKSLSVQGFFNLNTTAITVDANTIDLSSSASGSSLETGVLTAENGGITLGSSKPITLSGNLSTIDGSIVLQSSATLANSIMISTMGGLGENFNFISLSGSGVESLIVRAAGTATLGSISALSSVVVFSDSIQLNGVIAVNQLDLFSENSIVNLGSPQTITLSEPSLFNTFSGALGTLLSPIALDSSSSVIAGAPHQLAAFSGTTGDETIHPSSANVPCPLIFNGTQIPTTDCSPPPPPPPPPPSPPVPAPPQSGGAARITTGTDHGSITIVSGREVSLTSGTLPSTLTQILASGGSLSVQAEGNIQVMGASAYALIQSATDLVLESLNGDIVFQGGNDAGAYTLITTTTSGNINLFAPRGAINATGGSATSGNTQVGIATQMQGNITLEAQALNLSNGSGSDASVNIRAGTDAGSGVIQGTFTGLMQIAGSQIATGAGNIFLMTNDSVNLSQNASIAATGQGSIISIIAGNNISMDNSAEIIITSGGSKALIELVVDNNNPFTVGSGQFLYDSGCSIKTGNTGFVRIYTAAEVNNVIEADADINGLSYSKATSANEVWSTVYPIVPPPPQDGSDHFTIYYKSPANYTVRGQQLPLIR